MLRCKILPNTQSSNHCTQVIIALKKYLSKGLMNNTHRIKVSSLVLFKGQWPNFVYLYIGGLCTTLESQQDRQHYKSTFYPQGNTLRLLVKSWIPKRIPEGSEGDKFYANSGSLQRDTENSPKKLRELSKESPISLKRNSEMPLKKLRELSKENFLSISVIEFAFPGNEPFALPVTLWHHKNFFFVFSLKTMLMSRV